jgi:alpha-D-ribose 1-methylphosphonate 5-triphosphate diphosphatase
VSLSEAVGFITDRPARMSRLADRGRLEAGLRADLVRVRVHEGTPVVRQVWRDGERVS